MDVETLARIQFAFTIAFHYIYPPLSIGLGVLLVCFEAAYLRTKDESWRTLSKFWTHIFTLTFAIGVATGIVMEFEFGTNWATYSRYVGDIFGSALAAEGIFAFFLESGFLAILLFGWDKVGPKLHFFSALMVCLGAHFSAVWIVVANSWQQTPAGFHIVGEGIEARAEVTDFWEMVLNPSSLERLSHTIVGCWQAGAFLVLSISAFYILRKRHLEFAKRSFGIALCFATIATSLSLVTGHISAKGVAEHQPAKLAAMEGHYQTGPADLTIAGWVNEDAESVTGLKIPGGLSFLVHEDFDAPVTGLTEFAPEDRPPIEATFQFFHAMVGIGMALLGLSWVGLFAWWRGFLFNQKWLLGLFAVSVLGPQLANQLGWFTAEVGRQPWIVYGLLRTSEGLSKTVTEQQVLASLIGFALVYLMLFAVFVFLLTKSIIEGPHEGDTDAHSSQPLDMSQGRAT